MAYGRLLMMAFRPTRTLPSCTSFGCTNSTESICSTSRSRTAQASPSKSERVIKRMASVLSQGRRGDVARFDELLEAAEILLDVFGRGLLGGFGGRGPHTARGWGH